MIRLRKLHISGFRGAGFDLPLDFTKDYRSVSIFGENAAGKSTFTDALMHRPHPREDRAGCGLQTGDHDRQAAEDALGQDSARHHEEDR
jgi:hypothetical protein